MPKRAALRLKDFYSFQQVELTGEWANRKLLLTAKNFDDLPVAYQHFAQFLISQNSQLKLG